MSNQIWKNEKHFSCYDDAITFKTDLQHSQKGATLQVKIKRYGSLFIVKSRTDPSLVNIIKEVEEKLSNIKNR